MNQTVKILPNYKKFNDYIENIKGNISPIMLSGLTDVAKVHFAFSTYFYTEKPICIITYNELQAKKLIKDLSYFLPEIEYFPKREILSYDYLAESKELAYQRIDCLNKIYNKTAKIVVTTIESLSQEIISIETLYKNIIEFKVGNSINLNKIKEKLYMLGYERCDMIESKAEYSVRGGIIDIAISEKQGIRIELWGDEIDSIRYFDISSQRSTDKLEKIRIYPATEFVLENSLSEVIDKISEEKDIEELKNGDYINKIDKYFNEFYTKKSSFIDYLKKDYIIFFDEIGKIKARSENIIKDNKNVIKSLIEKGRTVPQSLLNLRDYIQFLEQTKDLQTIYLEKQDIGFVDKQSMHAKRNGYSFSYREVNFFRSSMDLLFKEIQKARKDKTTTVILCGSLSNVEKVKELLKENIGLEILSNPYIKIVDGSLSAGFECYDFNFLIISVEELFNIPRKRKINSLEFKQGETVIFSDLKIGDYVVHKTHGIGQFIGVNTIKADGITKDYIKIKYKDDDILYIPTNNLDTIRKYIGGGDREPKLNRLGSKEWANTKQKVKSNLQEIAKDLIELYAKREKTKGYAFSQDTPWQKEFEDSFPYVETDDQLRAIEEMKKDMEKEKPMDRLLSRRRWVW